MRQIIHPSRHKIIIVSIAALVSFLGFEALSLAVATNQIENFFGIAFATYLFLVFWQTFIFDLNLRKLGQELVSRFEYLKSGRHWLEFQNYLILPGIIYWTTTALLYLNPFDNLLKQVWAILGTVAMTIAFWYLKTIFYTHKQASHGARQLIFLTKLYASFLAFAASLGVLRYFGYDAFWFLTVVFCVSFLLLYQALFQHHRVGFQTLKFLLGTGLLLGLAGYVIYLFWNVNFYSGAVVLAAIYNTIWGLLHHGLIDKDLSREVAYEYLAVLFVILVIVFSTTNFAQRV